MPDDPLGEIRALGLREPNYDERNLPQTPPPLRGPGAILAPDEERREWLCRFAAEVYGELPPPPIELDFERQPLADEDVERIVVVAVGLRNEAVVGRIIYRGIQHAVEAQHAAVFVEFVFSAASFWNFDDAVDESLGIVIGGTVVPGVKASVCHNVNRKAKLALCMAATTPFRRMRAWRRWMVVDGS